MEPLTPDLLAEIVRRIVAASDPDKIIVFGSYARGTAQRWSDLDLFIVKSGIYDKFELQGNLDGLFWDLSLPLDVLVRTPQSVTRMAREPGNTFVRQEVLERGKVIYERGKAINTASVL